MSNPFKPIGIRKMKVITANRGKISKEKMELLLNQVVAPNYRIIFNREKSDIRRTFDVADEVNVFKRFGDAKKALKDIMREDMRIYKEAIGRIHDLNESDLPDLQEG